MSDRHSESMPVSTITIWKSILFSAAFISIAISLFSFRKVVVGTIVRIAAYIVWSINLVGRVVPQQVLWILMVLLFLYIAVGSFYKKLPAPGIKRIEASPVTGAVETRMRWIEGKKRGIYFKWQMANLLGRVYQNIQSPAPNGDPAPSQEVRDFLEAGVNTTYADYQLPGLFDKASPTPFDIPLEHVVEFIEEQMEIRDGQSYN